MSYGYGGWQGGGGGGGWGGRGGGGRGGYGGAGISRSQQKKLQKKEKNKKMREQKQRRFDANFVKTYCEPGTKVLVRNLSTYCSQQDIQDGFEEFGEIVTVDKAKDHVAFVFFADKEGANNACALMDGKPFFGSIINVKVCSSNLQILPTTAAAAAPKSSEPPNNVYTKGLTKMVQANRGQGLMEEDDDDDEVDQFVVEPPQMGGKNTSMANYASLTFRDPNNHERHENGCMVILKCDFCPYASFQEDDMKGHLEESLHYTSSIYTACPDADSFTYKRIRKLLAVKCEANMNAVRVAICPDCKTVLRDIFSCALHHQFYHDDDRMGQYAVSAYEDETVFPYQDINCNSCGYVGNDHLALGLHWDNRPACHPAEDDVPAGTLRLYMCQICVTAPFYNLPEALFHVNRTHIKKGATYTGEELALRVVFVRATDLIVQIPPLPYEPDRPLLAKQWCQLVEQMMMDKRTQRAKQVYNTQKKKLVQLRNLMRRVAAIP